MAAETERPTELNVHSCVREGCDSILFFDWGLELLDKSGYNTPLGPGQLPQVYTYRVKACARCRTPQAVMDGRLVDLSALIGPEEIDTLIRVGQAVPVAAMDP
jgi:hypothetical protein